MSHYNVVDFVQNRSIGLNNNNRCDMHMHKSFINRLGLCGELQQHLGAVNSLAWNETGSVLASASDDRTVCLWDPFRKSLLHQLQTCHISPIMSVQILPQTNTNKILTGSFDGGVNIYDVTNEEVVVKCSCFAGKVCSVTDPVNPHVVWLAATGSNITQRDLRISHRCSLALRGHTAINCLTVNPRSPHLVAYSTNNAFVTILDFRKQRSKQSDCCSNSNEGHLEDAKFVKKFAPGHLLDKAVMPLFRRPHLDPIMPTSVVFSPRGDGLLVNYSNENIYIFNIHDKNIPMVYNKRKQPQLTKQSQRTKQPQWTKPNCVQGEGSRQGSCSTISLELRNRAARHTDFFSTLQELNKMVSLCQQNPDLYTKRAYLFLLRNKQGDWHAAVRDLNTAIQLDTSYWVNYLKLAVVLIYKGHITRCRTIMDELLQRFPQYQTHPVVQQIMTDVNHHGSVNCEDSDCNYIDYTQRFLWNKNTETDITQADYVGDGSEHIMAGCDSSIFFWDLTTGNIIKVLRASDDRNIVNCVKSHPSQCMVASSGLGRDVSLWSPKQEEDDLPAENAHQILRDHVMGSR